MQMYYQHLKLLSCYYYSDKFLFHTTSDAMISPIISEDIWTNLFPVASDSLKWEPIKLRLYCISWISSVMTKSWLIKMTKLLWWYNINVFIMQTPTVYTDLLAEHWQLAEWPWAKVELQLTYLWPIALRRQDEGKGIVNYSITLVCLRNTIWMAFSLLIPTTRVSIFEASSVNINNFIH